MSYDGHRITIGDTPIPNSLIQPGTYKRKPAKKIVKEWKDANGTIHQDILQSYRNEITFSIRVRTLDEQLSIASIFASQENLSVTYFDDVSGTYVTGTFFMDEVEFSHLNTKTNGILYNATQIHLTEY